MGPLVVPLQYSRRIKITPPSAANGDLSKFEVASHVELGRNLAGFQKTENTGAEQLNLGTLLS